MQQAIQSCSGHDGIASEDLSPVGEGLVAGQNDRLLLFISLADGLQEQAGVRGFEREVADFIDDQQCWPGEILDFPREPVFFECPTSIECTGHKGGV